MWFCPTGAGSGYPTLLAVHCSGAAAGSNQPRGRVSAFLLCQGRAGRRGRGGEGGLPLVSIGFPLRDHGALHACSLSVFHTCSLTSEGSVLKRSSSTTRPVLFSCRHSPSSTGRHSSRLPRSSSCVSPVSSPNRDGRDCRQLLPKFRVRSFLHWNSSLGRLSICGSRGGETERQSSVRMGNLDIKVYEKDFNP